MSEEAFDRLVTKEDAVKEDLRGEIGLRRADLYRVALLQTGVTIGTTVALIKLIP